MNTMPNWPELLKQPGRCDHIVQLYQDAEFLTEAVVDYIGTGLQRGEAAIVIATPEHRGRFLARLEPKEGQLKLLDAEKTLERFMASGMPEWNGFHQIVGGAIAELRLQYPAVRAYGEMVDVLWQRGQRDAAIRLEEYWNELGSLQTFSLLCAYRFDNLDSNAYGGPLESVCKVHTHLIPVRDYARLDQAVSDAARKILDGPLAQILLSLSANHRPATHMPPGQATLLWLRQNMPRTADSILDEIRRACAPDRASRAA
jgi:MEDS: MEthanogen/methylotroph, DcmR Sensory domain